MAEKASQSVFWSAINKFSTQAVQFVVSIVIARLVAPSEYGLIAMLSIFIGIAGAFVDSGFNNALIQKQGRTDIDYSTVFYFNIGIATLMYIALFVCAPLIASFYNQPILESLTRWVSLSIILSSLTTIQRTRMVVAHNFKSQAIIALVAVIISGVIGIVCALMEFGVWALVAQSLSSATISMILYWLLSKWKPLLVFSKESFTTLFSFGSKILASSILNAIYNNLYNLVIGKVYTPQDLGYYTKANSITQLPTTSIAFTLQGALYPFLCEAQNDDIRFKQLFLTYTKMLTFVIFPLVVGVFVLAEPFTISLLTEKWLLAVPFIQILIIAYSFYPLCYINCQTLNAKGRSDLFLKTDIIVKVVSVIILAISVPFGVRVMCWSMVLFFVINYLIVSYNVQKVIPITLFEQIISIVPSIVLSILAGAVAYTINLLITNVWVELVLGAIIIVVVYYLLAKIFKMKELNLMSQYVKQILKK